MQIPSVMNTITAFNPDTSCKFNRPRTENIQGKNMSVLKMYELFPVIPETVHGTNITVVFILY